MKLAFLIGGAVGYVLGAKAGRERYESIVATWRRLGGSQTVQSAAGVLGAQVSDVAQKARGAVTAKVLGRCSRPPACWGRR